MNTTCERKNSKIEHSDAPEMFTVVEPITGRKSTQCLSHAVQAEQAGRRVDVIRH